MITAVFRSSLGHGLCVQKICFLETSANYSTLHQFVNKLPNFLKFPEVIYKNNNYILLSGALFVLLFHIDLFLRLSAMLDCPAIGKMGIIHVHENCRCFLLALIQKKTVKNSIFWQIGKTSGWF